MSLNWKEYEDLRYLIQDHGVCEVMRNIIFIVEEHAEHEDYEKLDSLHKLIDAAGEVC